MITADNLRSGVAERVAHLAGRPADLTNLHESDFPMNPTVNLTGRFAQNAGFIQGSPKWRIAIPGTGYVGLVTGACWLIWATMSLASIRAPDRIAAVNRAEAPFHEPDWRKCYPNASRPDGLRASTDGVGAVAKSDLIFLAVGTPCRNNRI